MSGLRILSARASECKMVGYIEFAQHSSDVPFVIGQDCIVYVLFVEFGVHLYDLISIR